MKTPETSGRSNSDGGDPFCAAVLAALPEAVVVATPDGEIGFVNAAAETLFGWTAAELVGQSITVLAPPSPARRLDPVKWLARWAAADDVEQHRFLDFPCRRRDGREMPVEVRVREAVIDGARRIVLTARDNTERRREQRMLKDANLRAARILMVAEDAIVTIDADQTILFVNLAAERVFGWSADELIGQKLDVLIPPELRASHARSVDGFGQAKDVSRMMGTRPTLAGQRRNGEVFPLDATITKVSAAGVLTYTAHIRDRSKPA